MDPLTCVSQPVLGGLNMLAQRLINVAGADVQLTQLLSKRAESHWTKLNIGRWVESHWSWNWWTSDLRPVVPTHWSLHFAMSNHQPHVDVKVVVVAAAFLPF